MSNISKLIFSSSSLMFNNNPLMRDTFVQFFNFPPNHNYYCFITFMLRCFA